MDSSASPPDQGGGRKGSALRLMVVVCVAVGLALSAYLLFRQFQLLQGSSPAAIDVCQRVLGGSCDDALASRRWWFLGISLAGWGLVYYATLAVLFALGAALRDPFESQALAGAVLLTAGGAAVSVYLACLILAEVAPFCPLCLALQAVNCLVFALTLSRSLRSSLPFPVAIRQGVAFLRGRTNSTPQTTWHVVGLTFAALAALVVYQWVLLQTERRAAVAESIDLEQAWHEYSDSPRHEIPLDTRDARLGPPDAKIQLVVFSDFGCSGCRAFSDYPRLLMNRFPEQLTIVFKHAPGGAHEAASVAAQAAHRQGKFWQFHDELFARQAELSPPSLQEIARGVGLEMEAFEADLRNPDVRDKIESDVALADRLHIDATPALFLNGHRIDEISWLLLTGLIRQLLDTSFD